jgi:hypothetical protein
VKDEGVYLLEDDDEKPGKATSMTEEELVAAIEQHESASIQYGALQDDRIEALDYYLGRPMGNEVEGRSQVISRQVWDTVEWLKPQLADIFCSGEEVVAFAPRGPEDVKGAEQETDYVNHLVTQKNNWFEIWNSWSHDALVQKVGYVKAYWDDSEDVTVEKYGKLTPDEYALLAQDKSIEIVEIEEYSDPEIGPVYSCEVKRIKPRNVVIIENIPPENVRVSPKARGLSLQDRRLPFVEHTEYKTISELRADGFDVPDDISDGGNDIEEFEEMNRRLDSGMSRDINVVSDPSMRLLRVRNCFIRCDFNGDGMAELRNVIIVGTTVLHNEDADSVDIVALCPTPLPHRHDGLSVADAVMDLQDIQTALLRGALDNQYLANNGRYGVNEQNVNLDDMLDSRPGGMVRFQGAASENFFPLTHPTTGSIAVPMMEYMDKIGARRTGVSEQSQGLNPDALNNQAGRQANNTFQTAALQRIKFIARVFAETGVKNLFQLVHEITLKNSRQLQMVQLRGEWVPVNPREWTKRNDMIISVALGGGDRSQQMTVLASMRQMQLEMLPLGLAKPQNLHATMMRFTRAAGFKDAAEFWSDPTKEPPPPPQPPIEIQLEQLKQQGKMQELQLLQQAEAQKFQAEHQMNASVEQLKAAAKQRETQLQLELQAANDMRDGEREQFKAEKQAQLAQAQLDVQLAIDASTKELERYKADLDAQVKLQIAEMNSQTQMNTANLSAQTTLQQTDKSISAQAEAKKPPKVDTSVIDAITRLEKKVDSVEQHNMAPRKRVRGPDGKLIGVEINGKVIPIEGN